MRSRMQPGQMGGTSCNGRLNLQFLRSWPRAPGAFCSPGAVRTYLVVGGLEEDKLSKNKFHLDL